MDKPSGKPPKTSKVEAKRHDALNLEASANAPILYCDLVSNAGVNNGVVSVTLDAYRHMSPWENETLVDRVIVAHLRMSIATAQSLFHVLQKVMLAVAPTQGDAN